MNQANQARRLTTITASEKISEKNEHWNVLRSFFLHCFFFSLKKKTAKREVFHALQRYAYNVDFFVVILFVVFLNSIIVHTTMCVVCVCTFFLLFFIFIFGSTFTIYLHFTNYRAHTHTHSSHWLLLIENKPLTFCYIRYTLNYSDIGV